MAACANHDLWKDCMKREEKIRNKFKMKVDEKKVKVLTKLMPVYERQTTTIKKEKFYASPVYQTFYTSSPRNTEPIWTKNASPVTFIPADIRQDHSPALHLVNSCPQMKTCQLPIFHKSASTVNMVKGNLECAKRTVVKNEYQHPQHCHPTVHKTETVKLEPHIITATGDQGIPFQAEMMACQLPIFHKSASVVNMAHESEHLVKVKHECAERALVKKECLHPLIWKERHHPTMHKTETLKLEPQIITTIGDHGIPFREELLILKK